jgi:transcriptional regulator with XRE-family HTH domain
LISTKRGEAIPSIDAAKKIANALEVSLDYLVGEGINAHFDKKNAQVARRTGTAGRG